MDSYRSFQAAVAWRSALIASAAASLLALAWRDFVPALALLAGTLIGLACQFHIAGSFNRLVKGGKRYLPFLPFEGVLRVLLAGAAPFVIVGRGPWLGYFTYLAGFVAPLAVAIFVYQKQIIADRDSASA